MAAAISDQPSFNVNDPKVAEQVNEVYRKLNEQSEEGSKAGERVEFRLNEPELIFSNYDCLILASDHHNRTLSQFAVRRDKVAAMSPTFKTRLTSKEWADTGSNIIELREVDGDSLRWMLCAAAVFEEAGYEPAAVLSAPLHDFEKTLAGKHICHFPLESANDLISIKDQFNIAPESIEGAVTLWEAFRERKHPSDSIEVGFCLRYHLQTKSQFEECARSLIFAKSRAPNPEFIPKGIQDEALLYRLIARIASIRGFLRFNLIPHLLHARRPETGWETWYEILSESSDSDEDEDEEMERAEEKVEEEEHDEEDEDRNEEEHEEDAETDEEEYEEDEEDEEEKEEEQKTGHQRAMPMESSSSLHRLIKQTARIVDNLIREVHQRAFEQGSLAESPGSLLSYINDRHRAHFRKTDLIRTKTISEEPGYQGLCIDCVRKSCRLGDVKIDSDWASWIQSDAWGYGCAADHGPCVFIDSFLGENTDLIYLISKKWWASLRPSWGLDYCARTQIGRLETMLKLRYGLTLDHLYHDYE